jgi:hypothetical protein
MASVLDLGLIGQFSDIFSLIFIFLIVYSVLEVTKVLGQNRGVHSLVALMIALVCAINPNVLSVISNMSPWFVLLIVFILFLMVSATFAGFSQDNVLAALGGKPGGAFWIIIISILILAMVLGNVFGQTFLQGSTGGNETSVNGNDNGDVSTGGGSFQNNLSNTLFHPKVLGLLLVFLIASFAIRMLTSVS